MCYPCKSGPSVTQGSRGVVSPPGPLGVVAEHAQNAPEDSVESRRGICGLRAIQRRLQLGAARYIMYRSRRSGAAEQRTARRAAPRLAPKDRHLRRAQLVAEGFLS